MGSMEGWTDESGWELQDYEIDDLSTYKESRDEDLE
jgi:hypothetical protein